MTGADPDTHRTEVLFGKASLIEKQKRKPKFAVRAYTRCNVCGRSRGVIRRFGICRICFREMAHKGLIPGVTKSSW